MAKIEKCFLTGQKVINYDASEELDCVYYYVRFDQNKFDFKFHHDYENSKFVNENLHILKGLLINSKFPSKYCTGNTELLNNEILEKIIRESPAPITPQDKLDNLLLNLHELTPFDGAEIKFPEINRIDEYAYSNYLNGVKELMFYMGALEEYGLILAETPTIGSGNINVYPKRITYSGLERIRDIQEKGEDSNRCFVAMSFDDDMYDTREAIRETVLKTGFSPIFIDEVHYPADQTIHEGMLKEIKRAKFLVSDFTMQKHGVYFEAGYALGLGRYVIYMSNKGDFKNCHFDTKSFPHIVYDNLTELKQKLEDKIEAYLK